MKLSYEMNYLTQNPHCGCDPIEQGKRIGSPCRTIGHVFFTHASWIGYVFRRLVLQGWMSVIMLTPVLNCLLKKHERATFSKVEVPEQSGSCYRRVGRSAHATKAAKSTTGRRQCQKPLVYPNLHMYELKSINTRHDAIWMALGCSKREVPRKWTSKRRTEMSTDMSRLLLEWLNFV